MQIKPAAPALSAPAGQTRTILMGRNRLNAIENWVKPPKSARTRGSRPGRPAAEPPAHATMPIPVSRLVRTTTLAAPR